MNGVYVHMHTPNHQCLGIEVPDAREAPVRVILADRSTPGGYTDLDMPDADAIRLLDALRERYGETEVPA